MDTRFNERRSQTRIRDALMANEIINRVANSAIMTVDLEDFYPQGERVVLDISQWLLEGIVLKEKEFRLQVKKHDWSKYKDCYVALGCSTNAIIPGWAYMLISLELTSIAKKTIVGSLDVLESILFASVIENMNVDPYIGKPVIIKGCSNKPIPENAFVLFSQKLQPIAKSIMYGEACSAVPLFKKKKVI